MELSILNLLVVLLVAWSAGRIAARLGYPSVLGELVAGILLGPPVLGLIQSDAALVVLAEIGILLMMVYIGMEIDPRELGKASRGGLLAAIGGFITPFVLSYFAVIAFGGSAMTAVFVGTAAGVTSLATKSRILVDLRLLDTRIAHVMMAGALIADTVSLVIFAAVLGVADAGRIDAAALGLVAVKVIVFFVLAGFLGQVVFPRLGRWLRSREATGRTATFTLVLILALGFAELAHLAGMHGILGAFVAGLFLREGVFGRAQAHELTELVRDASIGFLAPVFFVTAGFAVSLDVFTTDLDLLLVIVGLATVGKIVGTALFYLPTGHGWREGLTIGAGMNGRGAVEIIIAQIGLSMGLITQEIFSILVVMALFTTATVPVLLKWGTDWLRRRGELVRSGDDRKGVLIVGAGATARALGRLLSAAHPVTVVDRNAEHCEAAEADGLTAVRGNALDEQVLADAGAARARYAVVATPNAEVNALAAQQLRSTFLVPDIAVAGSGDEQGHEALMRHVGGRTLFGRPVDLLAWDYRLGHGGVEVLPVGLDGIPEGIDAGARRLGALPAAVGRGAALVPYAGNEGVEPGDTIHLLRGSQADGRAHDAFDRLVATCPVLDIDRRADARRFFETAAAVMGPRVGLAPDALADLLSERETRGSTVFLPGLAIPHVIVPGNGVFDLLMARCRAGITFEGEDRPVQTIFVLAGSDEQRTAHLRALSAIAQVVQRPDFETAWSQAPGAEALRELVLRAERRRFSDETTAGS